MTSKTHETIMMTDERFEEMTSGMTNDELVEVAKLMGVTGDDMTVTWADRAEAAMAYSDAAMDEWRKASDRADTAMIEVRFTETAALKAREAHHIAAMVVKAAGQVADRAASYAMRATSLAQAEAAVAAEQLTLRDYA